MLNSISNSYPIPNKNLNFSRGNDKCMMPDCNEPDLFNVMERWLLIHRIKPSKFTGTFPVLERFNSNSKARANVISNIKKPDANGTKKIKQKKRENIVSKCVFSCGRTATGAVRITEKTSLQLCDTCHQLLDPVDKMAWISF